MEVLLHNSFEIVCGGRKSVLYNTVLAGVNEKFLAGENYTEYIAFGGGRHLNLNGVTALSSLLGVKKSSLGGINRDLSRGAVYIKKCIELGEDEFNGVTITEAALTPNSDGSGIVNYAVISEGGGSGVVKAAGKCLTITATVFITLSGSRAASVCGGANPLFDILFGLRKASDCNIKAVAGQGVFRGDGMPRSAAGEVMGGCEVSLVPGALQISAQIPETCDCGEIVITVDGLPALSFSAKYNLQGAPLQENITVDFERGEGCAEGAGLNCVLSVSYGGQSKNFGWEKIADGGADFIRNPFEITVKPSDRIFGGGGGCFAVYGGDSLNVYDTSGGELKQLGIYYISFAVKDIQNIMFDSGGNMYVSISSYPYIAVYYKSGGALRKCSNARSFAGGFYYTALAEYGGARYLYCLRRQGGVKTYCCYRAEIAGTVFSETLIKSAEGDIRHFCCGHDGREILYDAAQDTFTFFPAGYSVSGGVLEGLKDCDGAHIYGGNIFVIKGGKVAVYNESTGESAKLYESGVRRIFYGGGRLIKLHSAGRISGVSACKSGAALYPFEISGAIAGDITDVKVTGTGAVVCADRRFSDCYYIPFSFNRAAVSCQSLRNADFAQAVVRIERHTFKRARGGRVVARLKLI